MKLPNIKVLFFTKIVLLLLSCGYLFWDFAQDKLLDKMILFVMVFSLCDLINQRKIYLNQGYLDIQRDNWIYTGILIAISFVIWILLQTIDIDDLKIEKDIGFEGRLVRGEIIDYGYHSDGQGFLRSKPFPGSRGMPTTAGFLFLENEQKNRIGFISCSIFGENCLYRYGHIPKNETVRIRYQMLENMDFGIFGGGRFLILTEIQSDTVSVDRAGLMAQYRKELSDYQMFVLWILLFNIVLLFWNRYLYSNCRQQNYFQAA